MFIPGGMNQSVPFQLLPSAASARTHVHATATGGFCSDLFAFAGIGALFAGALAAVGASTGIFALAAAIAGTVRAVGVIGWNREQQTREKQCGQGKLFHRNSFRLPELW